MSRLVTLGWLCFSVGCASAPVHTNAPPGVPESTFGGVTFPETVNTVTVIQAYRWLDSGLGVSLTYVPITTEVEAEFTVYVYPLPDSSGTEYLRAEFDAALGELAQYTDQNRDGLEISLDREEAVEIVTGDGRVYTGWRAATTLKQEGMALQSLVYVFEKDGSFVKYRISYLRSLRVMMAPRVDDFLRETLTQIRVPPA